MSEKKAKVTLTDCGDSFDYKFDGNTATIIEMLVGALIDATIIATEKEHIKPLAQNIIEVYSHGVLEGMEEKNVDH